MSKTIAKRRLCRLQAKQRRKLLAKLAVIRVQQELIDRNNQMLAQQMLSLGLRCTAQIHDAGDC